jgi:hypothetical protein
MSSINKVTIGLEEFDRLRNKEKALDAIEHNRDAYVIYQVSESRWYAWKSYAGYGDNIIEALQSENKSLQEQLKTSEIEAKNLRIRMADMSLSKKWWQLW